MTRTLIDNCRIWQANTFIEAHTLVIEANKIQAILPSNQCHTSAKDIHIDADGAYVLPGFIDLHIHGSNGFDAMDASEDALQGICDFLVSQGTTSFLPTTMSDTEANITKAVSAMQKFSNRPHTPYLGVHLEGPYLNTTHRGSQPDTHLRHPNPEEYLKWFETGQIKLITMAPELDGGHQLIQAAQNYGVTVALGHSGAKYEQAKEAFEVGLSQITHTFNGMAGIHHREPGAFVAASENSNVTFQVITDGVHIHPAMVNMIIKLVGIDRVLVITDAMRAAGLADGDYQLGDVAVHVTDGEARTAQGGLAGSTLTMSNALRNVMQFANLSLVDAIPMLTSVPAKSIGMYPQKGSLDVGTDADLILWKDDMGVQTTILGGQIVYERENVRYV